MIIISDAKGRTDSVYHSLINKIFAAFPIVLVSWVEDFIFNEELLGIKDYVLCCFAEEGWDIKITESHLWGVNSEQFPRYYNGDWIKFDNWVKENPPKLFFKRELLKENVTHIVKPIEYPCVIDKWPIQSEQEFNSRPVSVFQYWGRSNEHRIRIHGQIWNHAFKKGFQPCDNVYYINQYLKEEQGEKWITLWIPHWARIEIDKLMPVNNISKLSLSWEGAGFKCFRHSEAPVNSVMVMHKNDFAWAYGWDKSNCILVEHGKEIEGIEAALNNPNLYNIYLRGVENCDKYRIENYIKNYIEPLINSI